MINSCVIGATELRSRDISHLVSASVGGCLSGSYCFSHALAHLSASAHNLNSRWRPHPRSHVTCSSHTPSVQSPVTFSPTHKRATPTVSSTSFSPHTQHPLHPVPYLP